MKSPWASILATWDSGAESSEHLETQLTTDWLTDWLTDSQFSMMKTIVNVKTEPGGKVRIMSIQL